MTMKCLCAWCHSVISEDDPESAGPISHGICRNCGENIFANAPMTTAAFVDRLRQPVLVVDELRRVLHANPAGHKLLDKDFAAIEGRLGQVFDCMYAGLPGGCGKTVHCSACEIRRSVAETYRTGLSRSDVLATLKHRSEDGSNQAEVVITTEKLGGLVLLRVDQVDQAARQPSTGQERKKASSKR
jgi:hypothetical protein